MESERKELHDGWKWVKLGDVCKEDRKTIKATDDLAKELPYLSLEHIQTQTGAILWNPSDISEYGGKSNTFFFDDRHILYGKLRPYLNKVAIPNFAGRCTTELIPIIPIHVTRDYLVWILRRPESVAYAMKGRTGSRMPRTNMKEFMSMDIPLPPLEEQKRITAILDERMAAVEKARKAAQEMIDAVDSLKNAILRELLPYLGQELAEGWKWVRLGDVCAVNPRRPRALNWKPDTLTTFVPMSAVDEQFGVISDPEDKNYAEVSRGYTYFEERDVLFAKITPCMQNGKHAIASGLLNGFGFGSTEFHVVRPSAKVIPAWVHSFLRHPSVLSEAERHFRGAVGQQRVPKEFLTELSIPLPPLEEQKRIAETISQRMAAQERAKAAALEQLDAIEALRPALLRQAFSGAI